MKNRPLWFAPLLLPLVLVSMAFEAAPVIDTASLDTVAVDTAVMEETPPTELDVLGLGAAAKAFLAEHVPNNTNRDDRFRSLVDAVFNQDGLGITYGNTSTKTAQQTFDSGSGNCLSFTLLFVALAREVGLDAYFHEVSEALSWDQRGDVLVVNMHMFAEVEIDNGKNRVDFLPGDKKHYLSTHRISDQRALAHFLNNQGVEQLAAGNLEGGADRFRAALAIDEAFSPAWTNLGVALRRQGLLADAEEAYGRAIEVSSADITAQWNLASLYFAVGRIDDGEALVAKVEEHRLRNPFYQFRLGVKALAQDEPQEAVAHLREAVRLRPEAPDFHEVLADAYSAAGNPKRAASSLRRALTLSTDGASRSRLQSRLASSDSRAAKTKNSKN